MAQLTYDQLRSALLAGGPSVLVSTTDLAAAGGPEASVAPARFVAKGQQGAVYAYERRYVDGQPCQVVIIDSKQSQLNRAETALQQALDDGNAALKRLPHVAVAYEHEGVTELYTDLMLPHRAYDGHVRAGTVGGVAVTQMPEYRAVRNATPANARALLEFSPITLVFGGWDASRRSRQGRWRSALVGEIIGVLADQHADTRSPAMRGGARVDPVAMQVNLDGPTLKAFAEAQKDELSGGNYDAIIKAAAKPKEGGISASALGLGGIPPSLDQLAGRAGVLADLPTPRPVACHIMPDSASARGPMATRRAAHCSPRWLLPASREATRNCTGAEPTATSWTPNACGRRQAWRPAGARRVNGC